MDDSFDTEQCTGDLRTRLDSYYSLPISNVLLLRKKFIMFLKFFVAFVILACVKFSAQQQTFTNPILDRNSADPAVLKVGNYYYLTLSDEGETVLSIYKSPVLTDFRNAERVTAYRTKEGQR